MLCTKWAHLKFDVCYRSQKICHIHNYTEYYEQWNVFSAFNPSKLEQWAADCVAPGEQFGVSVPCSRVSPQSWTLPAGARIWTHNLGLPWVLSPTFYPLGHDCPIMSFWSSGVGIWSHSCLIKVSSCWRVRGCLVFYRWKSPVVTCLYRCSHLYRWLQAGQFSTRTLLLRSHAVVLAAVCGFAWNRRHLEGSICCSKTFIYTFQHSACQNMQAAHTVCTYAPPYHQRCWPLNWTLMTCWKVSLLFRLEDTAYVISNKNIKFRLTEHFSTLKQSFFKWALAHRTQRRFWTMFTHGFLFAW